MTMRDEMNTIRANFNFMLRAYSRITPKNALSKEFESWAGLELSKLLRQNNDSVLLFNDFVDEQMNYVLVEQENDKAVIVTTFEAKTKEVKSFECYLYYRRNSKRPYQMVGLKKGFPIWLWNTLEINDGYNIYRNELSLHRLIMALFCNISALDVHHIKDYHMTEEELKTKIDNSFSSLLPCIERFHLDVFHSCGFGKDRELTDEIAKKYIEIGLLLKKDLMDYVKRDYKKPWNNIQSVIETLESYRKGESMEKLANSSNKLTPSINTLRKLIKKYYAIYSFIKSSK